MSRGENRHRATRRRTHAAGAKRNYLGQLSMRRQSGTDHGRRPTRPESAGSIPALRSTPRRIQRRRTKGWRMPLGAVFVGRPSRWGNPWRAGDPGPRVAGSAAGDRPYYLDAMLAVGAFERLTVPEQLAVVPDWLDPLRGRDLVCWCRLDQPCHADVLLKLASGVRSTYLEHARAAAVSLSNLGGKPDG